jgi:hypothetical protein
MHLNQEVFGACYTAVTGIIKRVKAHFLKHASSKKKAEQLIQKLI